MQRLKHAFGASAGVSFLTWKPRFVSLFAVGGGLNNVVFELKVILEPEPDDFFVFNDEYLVLHISPPS